MDKFTTNSVNAVTFYINKLNQGNFSYYVSKYIVDNSDKSTCTQKCCHNGVTTVLLRLAKVQLLVSFKLYPGENVVCASDHHAASYDAQPFCTEDNVVYTHLHKFSTYCVLLESCLP